jgi:hypothetical protein
VSKTNIPERPKIQRLFRDITINDKLEQDTADVLDWHSTYGTFDWDTLLESMRIMIVSEAGVGKSYECKGKCNELMDRGETAFSIELSQLSHSEFRDLLSDDEKDQFDTWLATPAMTATFFLDSIDELKLTPVSFEQALKRIRSQITGHLGRARIVITSRPIAIDEAVFRKNFPIPGHPEVRPSAEKFADAAMRKHTRRSQPSDEAPEWRTVALAHLSENQIRQIASLHGVEDADALLEDIRNRNAQAFARRPQDLIELCTDWKEHKKIRTHAEQVEHNIEVKLRPGDRDRERTELSVDKARSGARRLALAALLTRKLTIRHSSNAGGASLDPRIILSDWSEGERATLLERALFGFASYGAVRFHHRSVIEYLAAEQLSEMMRQGASLRSVLRILFSTTHHEERVLKPSMRATAAWLSIRHAHVFDQVVQTDASVLLLFGDPSSLDAPQKRKVLRTFVEQYGRGGWKGLRMHGPQITRFASRDIEEDIKELWSSGIANPEVRQFLLSLIGNRELLGCADIAFDVAFKDSNDETDRLYAIIALSDLGDQRLDDILNAMENDPVRWPGELIRAAVMQLSLQSIGVERLCSLLRGVRTSDKGADGFRWYLPQMLQNANLSIDELLLIRDRLTSYIVESSEMTEKWPHYATERSYLLPALICTCRLLLERNETDVDLIRSSVIALTLSRDNGTLDGASDLRRLIAEVSSPYRAIAFWSTDQFLRHLGGQLKTIDRYARICIHGPIDVLHEKDYPWVTEALQDHSKSFEDRELMLYIAKGLGSSGEKYASHLTTLTEYVADDDHLVEALRSDIERASQSGDAILQWKIQEEESRKAREAHDREEAEARESWVKFRRDLNESPEHMFSEARDDETSWNLWRAMAGYQEESGSSAWSRKFLEDHIGRDGADRARLMLMRVWRKQQPTLPSERAPQERNVRLMVWDVGQTGLAAESEDPLWTERLTTEHATLAARFAMLERNAFPEWLDDLVNSHPCEVDAVIKSELTFELNEIISNGGHSMTLHCVAHGSNLVGRRYIPILKEWLTNLLDSGAIAHVRQTLILQLQEVVKFLIDSGNDDDREFLRSRSLNELKNRGHVALSRETWLPALMSISPDEGTDYLDAIWSELEQSKEHSKWIASLFGSIDSRITCGLANEGFTPDLLLRLTKLAYRAAPHVEGSETEQRGNAEQGRAAILSALLDKKGPEAWTAKMELANDPGFAHFKDRAVALAKEKASEDADMVTLSESEFRTMLTSHEVPPKTRYEMFDLLGHRLDDLEDMLLHDSSPRQTLARIDDESEMRRAIAREFELNARGSYTVDQEGVTADDKETDIRLRAMSGIEAVIELKLADKGRSIADLSRGLRDQLVTKYMAPEYRRSGCFLITLAKDRRWRHPTTNATLEFEELIKFLSEEAAEIVQSMGHQMSLTVRGLDLRPRLRTERSTKDRISLRQ